MSDRASQTDAPEKAEAPQSQISVSYNHYEDRLLLRVACDGRDSRIWLTRRMVKNVFLAQEKLDDLLLAGAADRDPAQKAIQDFMEEAAYSQADLSTPYQSDGLEVFPRGGPLLAVKISFTPLKSGRIRMVFKDPKEREMPFTLRPSDFRMMVHLISEGVAKAEWALEVKPQDGRPGGPAILH